MFSVEFYEIANEDIKKSKPILDAVEITIINDTRTIYNIIEAIIEEYPDITFDNFKIIKTWDPKHINLVEVLYTDKINSLSFPCIYCFKSDLNLSNKNNNREFIAYPK